MPNYELNWREHTLGATEGWSERFGRLTEGPPKEALSPDGGLTYQARRRRGHGPRGPRAAARRDRTRRCSPAPGSGRWRGWDSEPQTGGRGPRETAADRG